MSKTAAEKIQSKTEEAHGLIDSSRRQIAEMAEKDCTASDLGNLVNRMAAAQGAHKVWARLLSASNYLKAGGEEITKEIATQVALELLQEGADDTWSGRGNDLSRCRFDGIRDAVRELERIF